MDRVENLRASRGVPQVAFSEYLKIKSKSKPGPVLVFEGKQCPAYYISKVSAILGSPAAGQLLARGKRNVIELRDLILRNITTANDFVLYFVDQDYDDTPIQGTYPDVYVTRGYSIENEFFNWAVIESFVRANFDIADAADQEALESINKLFESTSNDYLDASTKLHKAVYICRRNSIRCLPGESISDVISLDWGAPSVRFQMSDDELMKFLGIAEVDRVNVLTMMHADSPFDELDRRMRWRGKYHFSFIRALLIFLYSGRTSGKWPFKRAAKIIIDPSHPSLIGHLSSYTAAPGCLDMFVRSQPA